MTTFGDVGMKDLLQDREVRSCIRFNKDPQLLALLRDNWRMIIPLFETTKYSTKQLERSDNAGVQLLQILHDCDMDMMSFFETVRDSIPSTRAYCTRLAAKYSGTNPYRKPVYEPKKESVVSTLSVDSDLQLKGVRINKDQIIGKGHFGVVYFGTYYNTPVALKTIGSESDIDAQEAKIWKNLKHPNIAEFFGLYRNEKELYMCISFYESGDLKYVYISNRHSLFFRRTWLSLQPEVSETLLIRFAKEICSGMCYLVEKNVIHRDLAARNVLLDSSLKVRISDFGMSRVQQNSIYTSTKYVMPYKWCAPEAMKDLEFSEKSDVW